jgi:hypothetical protein
MQHMKRMALVLAAAGILSTDTLSSHHSFDAEFDRSKTITVTGSVTKLEWTNPHARLYVNGADETGKVQEWDFELGPPNGLMRRGWNRNSLRAGHKVTVNGFRSKNAAQAHVANARTVTLADGRQVFAGSSFDTGSTP